MPLIGNICHRSIILIVFIIFAHPIIAQTITGQVIEPGGKPLPFATIKFGNTKEGVVANLEGKFSVKKEVKFIEVSHTNYITRQVEILPGKQELVIVLQPATVSLEPVVVVKASGNKLKRILNTAIANRSIHNPDKYNWYQCNVYYKMLVDFKMPDSTLVKDSSGKAKRVRETLNQTYFMLAETYSKRTWQKPAKLQEQIIASRMSGFTKPIFLNLVTDVLPFHTYDDFITLNGKDFYNPISKGLYQRFQFKLTDEIVQQADTTWVIDFKPKSDASELAGTVYITSDGFAITHIIAHSVDTASKKDLGIDQQYAKYDGKWFPQQLNYILQWEVSKQDSIEVIVKGTSVIDSVNFKEDKNFTFDKAHTIQLPANPEDRTDSTWTPLRPEELDVKERRTYEFMDSLFKKAKIERLADHAAKIAEGKFPAGLFDINLNRIYTYNAFENSRVGWGMQTSDKFSKKFAIGAWAGYGTKDKQWKYGVFAELYADKYKEFLISASYYNDLRDPGRLQIHKEIDNNTLRMFLISRADKVEGWNVSIKKKLGYLSLEAVAGREEILPKYDYAFSSGNKLYTSFSTSELSLNLRYAFGETSEPFLGRYYPSETKYPVLYGRIISGRITNVDINYTQGIAAVSWTKNINRLGKERFLLLSGVSFSRQPLPVSKLFAGNGFYSERFAVYTFGAMETMLPYQFYSDRFINFYWLHQFNRSLFHVALSKRLAIAPKPEIGYHVLYGTLADRSVHYNVTFSIPAKGYHEAGLMLNNVFRYKIFGLYYAGLKLGYFHNIPNGNSYPEVGRFVYGIGIEL